MSEDKRFRFYSSERGERREISLGDVVQMEGIRDVEFFGPGRVMPIEISGVGGWEVPFLANAANSNGRLYDRVIIYKEPKR